MAMTDCLRHVSSGVSGCGGGGWAGKRGSRWTIRMEEVKDFCYWVLVVKKESRMYVQNLVTDKQTMTNQITFLSWYYWQK